MEDVEMAEMPRTGSIVFAKGVVTLSRGSFVGLVVEKDFWREAAEKVGALGVDIFDPERDLCLRILGSPIFSDFSRLGKEGLTFHGRAYEFACRQATETYFLAEVFDPDSIVTLKRMMKTASLLAGGDHDTYLEKLVFDLSLLIKYVGGRYDLSGDDLSPYMRNFLCMCERAIPLVRA